MSRRTLAETSRFFIGRLIVVGMVLQGAVVVQAEDASRQARVLHFPADRSLGILEIYELPLTGPHHRIPGEEGLWDSRSDLQGNPSEFLHEARGEVVVPRNKLLQLGMNPQNLKELRYLRQLKPDDLDTLYIGGGAPWTARFKAPVMPYISGLTSLKELTIDFVNISGSDLQYLRGMKSLKFLKIHGTDTTLDAGLHYLSNLKSLEHLELDGCTDAGLEALAGLPAIKILWLGIDRIQGPGLAHLQKLPALRSLTLRGNRFSEEGLAYIRNLTSLTRLHLFCASGGDWKVTDAGLAHLAGLTALEELRFTKIGGLTDAGMVHLKRLRSLRKLDLESTQVTDVGLAQLGELKSLEWLHLPSGITDAGIGFLAQSFKLKELHASGERITNEGARHLAEMRSLTDLSLWLTAVNDEGMNSIAQLTNLVNFSHNGIGSRLGRKKANGKFSTEFVDPKNQSGLTDQGLARLAPLKSLKTLWLHHARVTISGLSHLNALPNLTQMRIGDVEQDNTGMNISGLTKLELFWIDPAKGAHLRDEDLACLAQLKNLRNLQFPMPEWMAAGDEGLKHLAGLTNLDTLVVGAHCTDDGLSYLKDLKKLDFLTIYGDFTDQGLRHLEELKRLRILRIYSEHPLGGIAVKHLQQALPCLYGPVETESPNKQARAASARRTKKTAQQKAK